MLVEKAETPPMTQAVAHRAAFFRQSGWLMFANIGGGVLMYAVHLLNKKIPPGEYGSFGVFLAVVMLLPTMPLQMVLAQQTAKAIATGREGQLAGVIRLVWLGTSAIWLIGTVLILVFQGAILARWKMASPVGLWITLAIVLLSLWLPMFWGILQGAQDFFWLGWTMLINGLGRVIIAAIAVIALHAYAAGMMSGVLLGIAAAVLLGAWQSRSLWLRPAEPFDWRDVLGQVLPLALGFLGFQTLFTADTIFVGRYFPKPVVDCYVSAGTMSRALMWLVLPLASVMFPRIVHSAARYEKTNLMGLVLLGTGFLSIACAAGLSLLGPWVIQIIYSPTYVPIASSVLPWYVSAMIPLALANVLLNNLLARPASKLVPSCCVVLLAAAYLFALTQFHGSLVTVLKTMGVFNLALLAVCAWFSWTSRSANSTPALQPETPV
jgi:O-antigen/teichoic acid export membrane protein